MELWQGALLGLVQGLTEFLPVSSSGHLVLGGVWLGVKEDGSGAATEALLHLGTLFAVVLFYRQDIARLLQVAKEPKRVLRPAVDDASGNQLRFIIIVTLVTGILGFLFVGPIEKLFDSPVGVAIALLGTSALLVVSRFLKSAPEDRPVLWRAALLVGLFQALAVMPGISRSGATMVAGLLAGIPRSRVGSYSFLAAVPIIIAATVFQLVRHPPVAADAWPCLVGIVVAAISGYFAMRWTLAALAARQLHWFAPYTAAIALLVLFTAS
jgi:undecaprenyl-diphosphatase